MGRKVRIGNLSQLLALSNDCHVLITSLINQHFDEFSSPCKTPDPRILVLPPIPTQINSSDKSSEGKRLGIFQTETRKFGNFYVIQVDVEETWGSAGAVGFRSWQEEPFWVGFVYSFLTWGFFFVLFGASPNKNHGVLSSFWCWIQPGSAIPCFSLTLESWAEKGEDETKWFYFSFGG